MACCRRYSKIVPIPGNPKFHADIREGHEAIVLAWASDDRSKALVELELKVPKLHKEKTTGHKIIKHSHAVLSWNLMRLDKYLELRAAEEEAEEAKESSDSEEKGEALAARGYKWLN